MSDHDSSSLIAGDGEVGDQSLLSKLSAIQLRGTTK